MDGLLTLAAGALLALLSLLALARALWRHPPEPAVMRPSEPAPHPAPAVPGPGLTCQICLGEVEAGCEYRVCPCGASYHSVCVGRTGFCPYCGESYTESGFRSVRAAGEPRRSEDSCPVCSRAILGPSCQCGAIFADEGGGMECPSCGASILASDDNCPSCGEAFESYEPRVCPVCDAVIHEGQCVCRCGLMLDDLCPECGWKLGAKEESCPICGLRFEVLGGDGLF